LDDDEDDSKPGGSLGKLFFEPTVVTRAKPAMRFFQEEIFGPVAPLYSFEDETEAIQLANIEARKNGRLEGWKDGRMEGWKDGMFLSQKRRTHANWKAWQRS
jgi:Aldehyde dehydrogenase family